MRKVLRALGRVFALLGGIILYAALAIVETGDMFAIMPGFTHPARIGDPLGLNANEALIRVGILFTLSLGIVLISLVSIYGIVFTSSWIRWTGWIASGLFIVYGLFQIVSAVLLIHKTQTGIAMAGVTYILIGLAVVGLAPKGRKR